MEDRLKRLVSFMVAALFIVASLIGVPVSDLQNLVSKPKEGKKTLEISDDCVSEIEHIDDYGSISDECQKEVSSLHRKLEFIEKQCDSGGK